MPTGPVTTPNTEQRSPTLDEAVRRVVASVLGEVDRAALRRALETEMAKRPRTLAALVKVGRRRVMDRVARVRGKAKP